MDLNKLKAGENPPHDINAVIEIPVGSPPVKYEMDKDSGMITVNRFWHTAMVYPANYGFIPHTLAKDGDPLDVLVMGNIPVIPGSVIHAVPVGVLFMEDDGGIDEKILARPSKKTDPTFAHINDLKDVPELTLNRIFHFFSHYKDLEEGKWTKVTKWGDAQEAKDIISKFLE